MTIKDTKAIFLFIIIVPLLISCSKEDPEEQLTNNLLLKARALCTGVSKENRLMCEESIQRLVMDYNTFLVSENNIVNQANKNRNILTTYRKLADKQCGPDNKEACQKIKIAKAELDKIEALKKQLTLRRVDARKRFDTAIASIPKVIKKKTNRISVICKEKDNGQFVCARLSTLIAYYDAEMNELLAQDINRLTEIYEISEKADILMSCGPGVWGGATLSEFQVAKAMELLNNLQTDISINQRAINKCAQIESAMGSAGGQASSGGFSGMTGFDPRGGMSACGFDIMGGTITTADVIQNLWDMSELFKSNCESQPWDTVASGGDDTTDDPSDDTTSDPASDSSDDTTQDSTTDNGDGTETVCTQYGCYVRYKDPASASSHATADDLNTTCTADGTCTTEVTGLDSDNNPMRVKETVYPDGTRITSISDDVQVYGIEAPDGSRYLMVCKGSRCRDSSAGPGEKLPDPWDTSYDDLLRFEEWLKQHPNIGVGDCIDGPCMSCSEYSDFMWDLKQGCANFGHTSNACQSYMNEAECCSNPDAFPSDPRITMPNPDGDFACYGSMDVDLQTEACKQRCSVASHEDCQSSCMSNSPAQLEFDIMDTICTKAISEECFYGSSGTSTGGERGPIGGGTPIPVQFSSHRVLPEINTFRGCSSGIGGCGDIVPR